MGMIQDITSLIHKGPEFASQINSVKMNNKSIAKGAKDSTFQFPVLIVDNIPVDMANTIARTLDQVYATFTQTWLSMNSMFDMTINPTPLSYLRKLHQNLSVESSEIDSYMDKVYDGKYRLYMNESHTYGVLFNVSDKKSLEMMESHQDMLKEYMSEFDLSPIEITEAAPTKYDFANAVLQSQSDKTDSDKRDRTMKQTEKYFAPKMTEKDIKKANDMLPYGIQVRLIAVNDKKEFVQFIDFIVGVKAVMHPVKSEEVIENIVKTLQNKSVFFKLLKWTTGEISLFKDIILNINELKSDAVDKANGKSPFFSTLRRLKNKKLGIQDFTVPHALIPNATIVITSYEANYLLNNYGINVKDDKIAKKIIDSMFLMSFIILDEGTGLVSVFYDGDSTYQMYSLESLEKDNSMNSNKLGREIGRMISH